MREANTRRSNPFGLPQSMVEMDRAVVEAARRGRIAPHHVFTGKVQDREGKNQVLTVIIPHRKAETLDHARRLLGKELKKRGIKLRKALTYQHMVDPDRKHAAFIVEEVKKT